MPTARTIKTNFYVKNILKAMLITGMVIVASTSPYFWTKILKVVFKNGNYKKIIKSFQKRNYTNAFSRLKSKGLIKIEKRGKQIYINLTDQGKKQAGRYQINDLEIKKPHKWDDKWRIVIFDVKDEQRIKRESLRGKLKQLNFYQVQKSVWAYPYKCDEEIDLLRGFFGLTKNELRIILAEKIEDDKKIREYYELQ